MPPILIGSDGSFVGQSKKTVQELSDKYDGESTDNLQTLDSSTCMTDDDLNLCSRCRTRGTACDGKKGRACAPCKKSKLSCSLSSTRISAAKSKGAFLFAISVVFSLCLSSSLLSRCVEEINRNKFCSTCSYDTSSDKRKIIDAYPTQTRVG